MSYNPPVVNGSVTLKMSSVNLNTTAPADLGNVQVPFPNWVLEKIYVANASGSSTSATVGFYTQAGGNGNTLVTPVALTSITTASGAQAINPDTITLGQTGTAVFGRLTVAAGAARTADIYVTVKPLF